MTALVNHGVPVALITTPQFHRSQQAIENSSHWTSEQFIGRIGRYVRLPDSLGEKDLFKVAEWQLPEGDPKAIEMLVRYAQGSAKYLAGIESAVKYARYLAGIDGREIANRADVKRAILEGVIPSDTALATALATSSKRGKRYLKSGFEGHLNAPLVRLEANRISATPEPETNRLTGQAVGI